MLLRFVGGALGSGARAEVAGHLDACEDCLALIADATLATQSIASDRASALLGAGTLSAGSSLGRYAILQLRGVGGLGEVYAAYDPKLDRRVALKVLRPALAEDDELRESVGAEARTLAQLHHPNVVSVFDVGDDEGRAYIAMELVDGMTLRQWLEVQKRGWSDVRDVFVLAAQGLAAAHAAGVVHRDFKPGNVLMSGAGSVKVADFGIARRSSMSDAAEAEPVSGTPAYMAPEQWRGEPATELADQFGFCASFFEALYGARPTDEIVRRRGAPPLRRITGPDDRSVPTWLRRVIETGLSLKPDARHADMRALIAGLTRDRRARGRRFLGIAAAALVSAGATWVAISALEQPAASSPASDDLIDQARAAAAASRFIYPSVDDPQGRTAFVIVLELEKVDPAAAARLRTELSEQLVALGDHYWERPGGRPFARDFYAAALVFEQEHGRAAQRAPLTGVQLADLAQRAAAGEWSEGELAAGESLAALAEPDDRARRSRLVGVQAKVGRPSPTMAAQLEALFPEPIQRQSARDSAPDAEVAVATPQVPSDGGRDASEPPGARRNPNDAKRFVEQGVAARKKGDLSGAERLFHRALEANPKSFRALSELSDLRFQLGEYDEALVYAKKAATRAPRNPRVQIQVGDAASRVFRYDEARAAYRKADELGSNQAQGRLARLDATLGK